MVADNAYFLLITFRKWTKKYKNKIRLPITEMANSHFELWPS